MMITLGRCGGGSEADVMFSMSALGRSLHVLRWNRMSAFGVLRKSALARFK
jgi:hypothetical protein